MDLSAPWWIPLRMLKLKREKVDFFRNQKYRKIKKQLVEQGCLFSDLTFPASAVSLGKNFSNTSSAAIEWKRPRELTSTPRLFDINSSSTRIEAGELSSNWIVSAFRIISGVRELCYKIIIDYTDQEWDLGSNDKYTGIFRFRFWRFGRWVEVVIDDFLPTINGNLAFTHSFCKEEFWVSFVEKAYAKLLGSYDNLEEGHVTDALVDLTGGVSEVIDLKSQEYDSNNEKRSELLHSLTAEMADHSIICASIVANTEEEMGQRTDVGLIRGQVYHMTAMKKIHLGDMKIRNLFKGREKVVMVRLRDTGAKQSLENSPIQRLVSTTEHDGYAYSTSHLTKLLSKNPVWSKIRESEKDRLGLTIDHDGEFWMPFEDFITNLEEIAVIRLFNNNLFAGGRKWHEASVKGAWTIGDKGSKFDRSGGGNINSETFLNNPQYFFEIKSEEEEVTIQMLQWEGVEPATPLSSSQMNRPRHRTLLISFSIIKIEINRRYRLHRLLPDFFQPFVSLDHQRKREVYYRGFFPKGRYLLVPTTFKPGAEGNFFIRIFSQKNLKLREIQHDVPNRGHKILCLSSPAIWVTIISLKGAVGLGATRNVYCLLKCENQKVKSEISKDSKNIIWSDVFVFYRKNPERPIILKVYNHQMFMRDKFIGWIELPASVNHSSTQLEVTLLRKDNNVIENAIIKLEVLTEDNLMAV